MHKALFIFAMGILVFACQPSSNVQVEIYTSSASGDLLQLKTQEPIDDVFWTIKIDSSRKFQQWEGFGGAITESSAHLLQSLGEEQKMEILEAYFSKGASAYNTVRLPINSCDFSLGNYTYLDEGDTSLSSFNLKPDRDDIIPIALQAKKIAGADLRFFASPWTAPPWMKDNGKWNGGKLKPEYSELWAQYFVKYAQAMQNEGIDIWAFTVENEPLGNDANWESMHYTPEEMTIFVNKHLAPAIKSANLQTQLLVYDQNRGEELIEWSEILLKDEQLKSNVYGTAVHWYTSTFKWFPQSLQKTHHLAPEKRIWNTEACVDAEVPVWQDDNWYWTREATDWGYTWAKEENKADHPKYVPVYRYARDIIGCINNWVSAWVDWNIVLDKGGGPNHASNWCIAPVIVDTLSNQVYYTPLYYTLRHFSQFIQKGAYRIHFEANHPKGVHLTALLNPNGNVVVPILNTTRQSQKFEIEIGEGSSLKVELPPESLETILLKDLK